MKVATLTGVAISLLSANAFAIAAPTISVTVKATPIIDGTAAPTVTATAAVTISAIPTVDSRITPAATATPVESAKPTAVPVATATPSAGGDPSPQCSDGLDNDGDGLVDLNDPDCTGPTDSKEGNGGYVAIPIPQCRDGIDNDGDGQTDLGDTHCSDSNDSSEGDPGTGVQCKSIITKNQKDALNEHAVKLTKIAGKAGNSLLKSSSTAKMTAEVQGSLRKIRNLRDLVFQTTLGVPDITATCPGRICAEVNNFTNIERLKGYIAKLRNAVKRLTARRYFKSSGLTQRNDPLVGEAKKTEKDGTAALAQFAVVQKACSGS